MEPTTIERIGARNTRQERNRENQCVSKRRGARREAACREGVIHEKQKTGGFAEQPEFMFRVNFISGYLRPYTLLGINGQVGVTRHHTECVEIFG